MIPTGSVVTRVVQADGGTIMASYWCDRCDAYCKDHWRELDDGIGYGELKEVLGDG